MIENVNTRRIFWLHLDVLEIFELLVDPLLDHLLNILAVKSMVLVVEPTEDNCLDWNEATHLLLYIYSFLSQL